MLDPYTQGLLDEFACRRLVEKYWWFESRHDAKTLATLFTVDARWGRAVGRDAITAQAEGFFTMMAPIKQNPTGFAGFDLEVDGDEAAGAVHAIAHLLVAQEDGTERVVVVDAIYDVRFRRESGEWLIAAMIGPDDPDTPHGASFQFSAAAIGIDFGMPSAAAGSASPQH